jgi:hypothetical protein
MCFGLGEECGGVKQSLAKRKQGKGVKLTCL